MTEPTPPVDDPSSPLLVAAPRHSRRRQILAIVGGVLGVLIVVLVLLGYQGWQVLTAITRVQEEIVVALPTRNPTIELGGAIGNGDKPPAITFGSPPAITLVPTAIHVSPTIARGDAWRAFVPPAAQATAIATPTVRSLPTSLPRTVPRKGSSFTPAQSPTTSPEPVTTPAAAATGGASLPSTATPMPVDTATATPAAPATPAATATATAPPPTDVPSYDASALDVARNIVSSAMESGDPGTSEIWGGKTSLNILAMGIDRRPDGSYVNADVVMIFHVDLIDKTVHVVSIPRDLLVQVPGVGWWKLNGAFELGERENPGDRAAGPAKMRDTIEFNFGVPIDAYVFVDFSGFQQIIDAAGGVTVDVPYDIYDPRYPVDEQTTEEIFFTAGPTTMDGVTALKYVRTRNADGDDARRQRQMQVLLALLDQGKTIGSIARADELIMSLAGSAQTSFTLEEQLTLARLALLIDRNEIRMFAVGPPLVQAGVTDTGMWVYVGDPQAIALFVQGALAGNFDNATPTAIPAVAPPADNGGSGVSGGQAPDPTDTPAPEPTAADPTVVATDPTETGSVGGAGGGGGGEPTQPAANSSP